MKEKLRTDDEETSNSDRKSIANISKLSTVAVYPKVSKVYLLLVVDHDPVVKTLPPPHNDHSYHNITDTLSEKNSFLILTE